MAIGEAAAHALVQFRKVGGAVQDWVGGTPCARHDMPWCASCAPTANVPVAAPAVRSRQQPAQGTHGGRRPWEQDEIDVLIALFFSLPFSSGDDSQSENHAMALAFGRSPAAVDRQWRNVQDVTRGDAVQHVGAAISRSVATFLRDERRGLDRARAVAERRGWAALRRLMR